MRLYGGAQYHRAMAEFRLVVGGMKCPPITREEIVNACGVEDIHDGTNYSRCCPSPKKFKNNKRKKNNSCLNAVISLLPLSQECLRNCCFQST
jgi:hypothetical protein